MQHSSRSFFLSVVTAGLVCVGTALAQSSGSVRGRAMDPEGAALQGAQAVLTPGGQKSVSGAEGRFTIPDVAAGKYTVTVSYIGFQPYSTSISVAAGAVAQVYAKLNVESVHEVVVVQGERAHGEVEALNRERAADNILQVLPAEVITSLPNTNVADAIGRLASISLERDEGEGKYVQIRGTEPRLSNVTINGVHISSPENNVRNMKLDIIPADLVESIEVSKTLSAKQDGDAIGGSVNLVTRTADEKPYYSVSGMGGYMPIVNGRAMDQFDGTIGRRFGTEKKFGTVFGGSYDYSGRGYNNIEPAPDVFDFGNGPVPVFDGVHIREYAQRRTRYGFAGGADYRFANGSTAFVRGLWSEFKDFGDTWNLQPTIGTFLTPTTSDADGKVVYRHLDRTPQQRVYSISAGEELVLGQSLLNYSFAVSRERQDGQFPSTYFSTPSNIAFGLDMSNPLTPKFPVLNGVNIYDPTLYKFTKTILANDHVRELDYEGSVSLAHHYVVGSHFGTIEAGGKIRSGDKNNLTDEPVYVATKNPSLFLSQALGTLTDPNFYFGQYKLAPLSDYKKILALLAANPSAMTLDVTATHSRSDPNNYSTTERVYAAYVMNTVNFGKARLQAGVRMEATQSNFTGYHVTFDTNGDYVSTSPFPGTNDYVNVLPSIQFQYAFTQDLNLRAAYGMGIARPNFSDLPPTLVDNGDRTLSAGNPALKPTRANNYDLLLERYLKPVGIIQAGFFYKDLSDPIYLVQSQLTSGTYSGFLQTQPVNGKNAHILGVEITYQQALRFLPGAMSGLGVAANYSYTTSRAMVPNRSVDPALLRQGPGNWNLNLTYDKARLSMRLGLTHNDAYIYQYNYVDGAPLGPSGPLGDVYTYAHTQVDAQGSYRIRGGLKFIVSLLNLNNEVFGFYQGSPKYPVQREFYGPTFESGLRWSSSDE